MLEMVQGVTTWVAGNALEWVVIGVIIGIIRIEIIASSVVSGHSNRQEQFQENIVFSKEGNCMRMSFEGVCL